MLQEPGTAVEVRSLANEAEREAYFRLNAQIFRSQEDIEAVAAVRRRFIEGMPTFHAEQLRGAFVDGQLAGGYMHLHRSLSIEDTGVPTGCISGVCTATDFRQRGVATALMLDALNFATRHQQQLLLLHGIPDFYHRFAYTDVCEDITEFVFQRELVEAQPDSLYKVRPVTRADAPAILQLYQEQQGLSPLGFAASRTVTAQAHLLFNWFEICEQPSVVALSPAGQIDGYVMLSRGSKGLYAYEVAARSWPAALALLHHEHSVMAMEPGPPEQFTWPVAPYTPLAYLLADSLPLVSSAYAKPNSGWMSRPLHLSALLKNCQPLLQRRWQSGHMPWAGAFMLQIAQDYWQVELATSGVLSLTPDLQRATDNLPLVRLSLQAFTQLLFGFRPADYLANQPGNQIPEALHAVLATLFPARPAWIAISDFF